MRKLSGREKFWYFLRHPGRFAQYLNDRSLVRVLHPGARISHEVWVPEK